MVNDEPDNRILECALAARTEAIVTGDRAVLNLDEYRGVRIIARRTPWATRNAFSARSGQRTQFLHTQMSRGRIRIRAKTAELPRIGSGEALYADGSRHGVAAGLEVAA